MGRPMHTKYDSFLLEQFKLGKMPTELHREINQSQVSEVISIMTVKRRYYDWKRKGSPGYLTLVERLILEDGTVMLVYKDRDNKRYTSQGK